jgi:hypothetical protein
VTTDLFEQFQDDVGETGHSIVIEGDQDTVHAYLVSAARKIIAAKKLYDPKLGPTALIGQNHDAFRHSVLWVRESDGLKAHVSVNGHQLASFTLDGIQTH